MDNHDLAIRRAILERLKTSASVVALVPVANIYEQVRANPEWPFIRYGLPIVEPVRADGWDIASHSLTVHAFANGPGTDAVTEIVRAIRNTLHDAELELDGTGGLLLLQYSGHNVIHDTPEASAYHAAVAFEAVTAEVAA